MRIFLVAGSRHCYKAGLTNGAWRGGERGEEAMVPIDRRRFGAAPAMMVPTRRGATNTTLGMAPALMLCWIAGGAGFVLFSCLPGGAELAGRSRPAPGVVAIRRGLNVELSLPIFRLALAVFIPWRGADGFDRRAGWHPR